MRSELLRYAADHAGLDVSQLRSGRVAAAGDMSGVQPASDNDLWTRIRVRKRARKDRNHVEVVNAFEGLGCTVLDLAQLGGGCPDLLVGVRGRNLLVEVKDGSLPRSARKLTPDQEEFFATWRGSRCVVESIDDVISMVKAFSQV